MQLENMAVTAEKDFDAAARKRCENNVSLGKREEQEKRDDRDGQASGCSRG